jgi:hypothetical protein
VSGAHSVRMGSATVLRSVWPAAAVLALAVAMGQLVAGGASARLAIAVSFGALAFGVWSVRSESLLYGLVLWTAVLGLLRRLISYEILGEAQGNDPLLLVLPLMVLLLAAAALRRGAFEAPTALSRLVALFTGLVLLGALNPLQVSLTAGMAALVFFVPVAAFWAGRALADDATLHRALQVVAVLAVPVALYGFVQLFAGFPAWDASWVETQGYNALNVGDVTRQFSTFSSAAEYAMFLVLGSILWLCLGWRGAGRPATLPVVALLVTASVYASSRGVIFTLVGTIGLLVAARRRLPFAAAVGVAAIALVALPLVVSRAVPDTDTPVSGRGALVSHQVSGLADPTGAGSTLSGHLDLVVDGVKSAFTEPLGHGISTVTIAGSKFGGFTRGTEADVSNAGVALGLPGLVLILLIMWQAFRRGYRLAVERGDALAFAALGVLGVTVLQWLNGGQYAVAYLVWFVMGWIDRNAAAIGDSPREATP